MAKRHRKNVLKRYFGFTLSELLIVMAIIGILMSITLVGYNSYRAKARDSQRKTDLSSVEAGMESYYTVNKQYPDGGCPYSSPPFDVTGFTTANSCLNQLKYLSATYTDPKNVDPFQYRYKRDAATKYEISAALENTNDKKLTDDCPKTGANNCDDSRLEYGTDKEVINTSEAGGE